MADIEASVRAVAQVATVVGYLNGVIRDIRHYIDGPAEPVSAESLRENLEKAGSSHRTPL